MTPSTLLRPVAMMLAAVRRGLTGMRFGLTVCVALAALSSLTGCAQIDAKQRLFCEAIVPLVEPSDARITLHRVAVDALSERRVTILYRVELPGNAQRSRLTEVRHLICQFAGTGISDSRLSLTEVETTDGFLSETPLLILNRFLINDMEALTAGEASLARDGDARIVGLIELDASSGYFLQAIINAGPMTALYTILALAYSLVYGLTNRINLAFGEIATIGAFGALIGALLAVAIGLPYTSIALPLAILCAFGIAGGSGAVIGRLVFLPLIGRTSQPLLVATIGLALVVQEFLARVEGVRERWLQPILADPHRVADGPFEVVVTTMQLLVVGGAAITVAIVILVLKFSRFGRLWRAVADDRLMARMLGVNVDRVIVTSFAIACGLAGLGGSILTLHYGGTSFAIGATIGLKALVAAVIGGIGSVTGAVLGGIALGLVEAMWSAYEPIVWRDGIVFIALVAFLILRPQGVLGTRRALEERDERL